MIVLVIVAGAGARFVADLTHLQAGRPYPYRQHTVARGSQTSLCACLVREQLPGVASACLEQALGSHQAAEVELWCELGEAVGLAD